MTQRFFDEFRLVFEKVRHVTSVRVVVVTAQATSKCFTAGLDLKEAAAMFAPKEESEGADAMDAARRAYRQRLLLLQMQQSFSILEQIPQPVICAVHGACIGGGIDLITAADIRIATNDATFVVKEIDIGLAADLGTLQRLPRVIGSRSLVNELALTARTLTAHEALSCGLVSRVCEDVAALRRTALEIANSIAIRSPVAVIGTKQLLLRSRDLTVSDGLDYTAAWNASMLQTNDIPLAVMKARSKTPPLFSNL